MSQTLSVGGGVSTTSAAPIEILAVICAGTGESEQACNKLALGITNRSNLSYSQLRLNPFWDSLRGHPRFEKIVAAPSAKWPRNSLCPLGVLYGTLGTIPGHW